MSGGTVVIGLGSPLMGDDGIGLAALERLREAWVLDDVDLVDGGTWGMSLLPVIEDARRVLFLDAIRAGAEPGELVRLERDALPRYFAAKLSPHQVDLKDVLAVAELRGTLPAETVAYGIQPMRVELGTELSSEAAASLDALVRSAVERLRTWGHRCTPRADARLTAPM
jgi:hydrogenase maturation protease